MPLLVISVLLLGTAASILPSDSIISIGVVEFNLERLLILLGFAAIFWIEGFRRELFRARAGIPLALLLIVSLYSSHRWGSSTYPHYRFLVESVAAFYLTFAVVRLKPEARFALAAVAVVALGIAALTAVAQVSQGEPTGFYRHGCTPVTTTGLAPHGSLTRAIGTFSNPNVLAGYLMLVVPLGGLALTVGRRVRAAVPVLALTLGFGYLAVIFTYSRAAVLVSIAVLGVGVALSQLAHRRYLILVALAAAIAVAVLLSSCGSDATAGFGRTTEWRMTLEVIRDNPVYGVGLGRLGLVLHHRNALSTAQHAHNLFLTWWAEAGTGALIAWVWLAVILIRRSLIAARRYGDVTALWGLLAMLGFFAFSMTDHPANVDRVALAFWIVAGLVAGVATRTARASPPPAPVAARVPPAAPPPSDGEPATLVPERPRTGATVGGPSAPRVPRRPSRPPSDFDFD